MQALGTRQATDGLIVGEDGYEMWRPTSAGEAVDAPIAASSATMRRIER